jgi:hypothetical protein
MLHGVVAVCPRSGALLFAKAYAPSFGLPTPGGGQPMDAHNLASLVFALQLNATAVLDGNAEPATCAGGDAAGRHACGLQQQPALRAVDMGPGLRLVFFQDPALPNLLLMLSLDPALGDRVQGLLAERICDAFAEAFGEQLGPQAGRGAAPGPVRRLRGASDIVQRCLASISQALLADLIQTFADKGSILWGHAMQADTDDLEVLGLPQPLEVHGAHLGGWDLEAVDGVQGHAGLLPEITGLPAHTAAEAQGQGFAGVAVVGGKTGHEEAGSPPAGCGYKRKAPEKLLSKCTKARTQPPCLRHRRVGGVRHV